MRNKNLKAQFYLLTAVFLFLAFSGGLLVQDTQGKIIAEGGNNDGHGLITAQKIITMTKPVKPTKPTKPIKEKPWQVKIESFGYNDDIGYIESMPKLNKDYIENTIREDEFTEVYLESPIGPSDIYRFFLCLKVSDSEDRHFLVFGNIGSCSTDCKPDENPCYFPNTIPGCPSSTCFDNCVSTFLNNTHPMKGYYPPEWEQEYHYGVLLHFGIPGEVLSNLTPNVKERISNPMAYLDINIRNEAPAPNGDKYHSLIAVTRPGSEDLPEGEGLFVTKVLNGWEIEFNYPLYDVRESYSDLVSYTRGKKEKTRIEPFYPLTVDTNFVHFKAIWTQY